MKVKKEKLKLILFLLLFLVVWGIAAASLYAKVENDKNNPVFSVELGESGDEKKLVSVTLESSKSWVNDAGMETETIGAQYDGIVNNLSTEELTDWKLEITLSGEGKLDSCWNGIFAMDGNVLYYTPDLNVEKILAGSSNSFGFVMISKELLTMESCVLNGYRDVTYKEYPIFYVLVVTLGLWFVLVFTHIIVEIQTRKFEASRERDAKIISETMKTFAEMIDAKDPYTKGHSVRVSFYAKELGRRMKLSAEELTDLGYIALMHDCGKMGVPDAVLTKPARLDPEERKQMEEHSVIGGKMLENYSAIEGIQDGAKYHHERYDGKGYPEGLKGEEIPLCARIICVADSYDAMTTDRCYRPRLTREKVLSELKENSGTQFDPKIVPHMIAMMEEGFYPEGK